MSLVLDERVQCASGELVLGEQRLPVACHITVEWIRGIAEPTWYGYFTPLVQELAVLPGAYCLRVAGEDVGILLWRPQRPAQEFTFSFWGVGRPPRLRAEQSA